MYEIRFCQTNEQKKLQKFIDGKWKKSHILSKDDVLLKWQYFNKNENYYNFVVANNIKTGEFDAILGFIPLCHYDKKLVDKKDIWLAIWKVDETSCGKKGIGLDLLLFLKEKNNPCSIGAIGINENVKKIYKYYGYKIDKLTQYYLLNTNVEAYKIAYISKVTKNIFNPGCCQINEIRDLYKIDDLKCRYRPQKSIEYIYNKYHNHPNYKYKLFGVYCSNKLRSIFIIRKINIDDSSCLRIVDIYGDLKNINSLGSEFQRILEQEESEYIDCLNYGISESVFFDMGFKKRTDEMIIPNYFEPFEKRNIDIEIAYKSNYNDYIIFKGDSDQDRPNL